MTRVWALSAFIIAAIIAAVLGNPAPAGIIGMSGSTSVPVPVAGGALADWTSRSTDTGVFFRHDFTWQDGAESDAIASDADLRDSLWGSGFDGTSSTIQWNQSIELTGVGGAACLEMPAASPDVYSGLRLGWDGINAATKNTVKYAPYAQFLVWADDVYRDFYYGGSGWGGKIAILEAPDSSFDNGEVVFRRWQGPGGFVKGYSLLGSVTEFILDWSSPAPVASDFTYNNFYDAGTPTVSSIDTLQQRHGPNYQHTVGGSPESIDSDLANAPRLQSDGWTVVEIHADLVNKVVKIWMADYGDAPVLVMGAMAAALPDEGTLDGSGSLPQEMYTGLQLTNFCGGGFCDAEFWPATDTRICYDAVIGSDDPIPFPGGHSLPNTGTTTPSGYPPAGSTEGRAIEFPTWMDAVNDDSYDEVRRAA